MRYYLFEVLPTPKGGAPLARLGGWYAAHI